MSKWKEGDFVADVSGTSIPEMEVEVNGLHWAMYEFNLWDKDGSKEINSVKGTTVDDVEDKFPITDIPVDMNETILIWIITIKSFTGGKSERYSATVTIRQNGNRVTLHRVDNNGALKEIENPYEDEGDIDKAKILRERLFFRVV